MTNNKDWSRWCTPGSKCKGCYTTRYVYYCITDHKGNKWESCEKCIDKLIEVRDSNHYKTHEVDILWRDTDDEN